MGLSVVFVSGPRRAGKSAVVQMMIDRLWRTAPHYVRLVKKDSGKVAPKTPPKSPAPIPKQSLKQLGVASARWIEYDEERIFEVLPEALTAIHRQDRYGGVIIEADADESLRFAYPYDHRIFVMPLPANAEAVFRNPDRAATELQRVLDDTAAFAREIFGLFAQGGPEDAEPSEERAALTSTQMRGFLYSPLGDELATRIQLRPPFHGLVESDVIIVNTATGGTGPSSTECVRRIQQLLTRLRDVTDGRSELFLCDPRNCGGSPARKLLKSLEPMCQGGC